ncbi:hypothetical protein YTPLAS72_24930 [Nitrospira sp.]|nr:hypothetical protein YTPLAS72_24930 [Nitrospira sp.]
MVPTLHKILTCSTAAKDHARRLLGFGSHEHNQALIRFAEEVQQAEDALIHSIETPSLTEIFNAVDCATRWAEKFGKLHAQTEAARKFSHDLKQVSLELQTACQMDRSFQQTREGIPTDAHLYDVLSWLTQVSSYARFVSVRQAGLCDAIKAVSGGSAPHSGNAARGRQSQPPSRRKKRVAEGGLTPCPIESRWRA